MKSITRRPLDQAIEEFMRDPLGLGRHFLGMYSPIQEEFSETDNAYTLKVTLPGVKQEDIKVTQTGDYLRISAHGRQEEKKEEKTYHTTRIEEITYERTWDLPKGVTSIKPLYENGLLTVTIEKPKAQQSDEKEIPIEKN
ncbi:MAG: Hsp20/alpha crystallin family protein [archaeon]